MSALFAPIMSPKSSDPGAIPLRAIVEELARELQLRRDSYPRRVTAGKMTAAQAERRIELLAAIHADLHADMHFVIKGEGEQYWRDLRTKAQEHLRRVTWIEIVAELQREITLRRRYYPQIEAEGERPAIILRTQLERLEAAHFLYWVRARCYWPAELNHKAFRGADLTWPERQTFRDAYERHRDLFLPIEEAPRGAYNEAAAPVDGWAA